MGLDKHGGVGRPGEFFDQDEDPPAPAQSSGPVHAGHGMLFDQDAVVQPARRDPAGEARRRQALERQRDREIELRRQVEWSREREERRRRALEAQKASSADQPLRISSRPVTATPPAAYRPLPADPDRRRAVPPAKPAKPVEDRRPAAARMPRPPSPQPATGRPTRQSTGQATAILAAGTFASRVTGFLRVLAVGYVLGVGSLSDAYNYANGVPNIIYDLLLGGVLSATLIPVFVEQLRGDDREESMRSVSAVLTAITLALATVAVLLWALAPWIIRFYLLLSPGSTAPAERHLGTQLLHYFAPQVFFLGAIVVSTALLNARRSFAAAAFSPVVNNLIGIAALLVTKVLASHILTTKSVSTGATLQKFAQDHRAILVLGLGTTAGYVAQLIIQLPAMRRAGLRLRPVWDLRHPAVRRVAGLSSWLLGVVIANQASLALVMVLAGRVTGGFSAYQFSYQFFQLPYALIAVSVASALMPDLSARWSAGDRAGFEHRFVSGLRVTLALLIPVGMAYAAIAQPFIQLAIHHGRVTQGGAHLVSTSLAFFAAGLPGFSAYFLLMRAYNAMQDARSMFWIYALENALTVVAALILEPIMGVPGLALAWVGPYTIASLVAAADLRCKIGPMGGIGTVRAVIRILVASGLTVAVVVAIGLPWPAHAGDAAVVARLVVQVGAGALVYLWLAKVLRIRELRPVIRLIRRLGAGRR